MTLANRFVCALSLLVMICSIFGGTPAIAEDPTSATITPRWDLAGLGGESWDSDAMKGTVVVLEFWATWCPSCRANLPEVEKLVRDYAASPVQVIAVNIRDDSDLGAFLDEAGLDLPVAIDGDQAADAFGVRGTPTAVVIDPSGRVALVIQGVGDARNQRVREVVDEILAGDARAVRRPVGESADPVTN